MKKDLAHIYNIQKEVFLLAGISSLLNWDEQTHMPSKATESRAEQLKVIEEQIHEKMTSNKLKAALNRLKKRKLSKKDRVIVKELDKDVTKLRRIPKEFVKRLVKEQIISAGAWRRARKKNDFRIFKPHLKKIIALAKEKAKYLNPKISPYDALLNEMEEGMTTDKLTNLFNHLKVELIRLLDKIKSTKAFKDQKKLKLKIKNEEELVKDIIKKMGLDKEYSAVDIAAHPFTIRVSENDVRITVRYIGPIDAFTSAVHEAGHALYELGLPKEYINTLIYDSPSLGLHESQSRFWENMVTKSKIFWEGYFNTFKNFTNKKISKQKFYKAINQVKSSFIRVQADEVTYCLHIILRFEIERDLMNGKLNINNAKKEWNNKFKEMFGIVPKTDNDGILQDVHWSSGSFGYFPTYAIGTIYSSQLYAQLLKDVPKAEEYIKKQKFKPILNWLRKNVHKKGRTMLAEDIIKQACGEGLNPQTFIKYLNDKYLKIYDFKNG